MERMNGIVGVVVSSVAVIVVVVVGWLFFISPQRSKADRLSAQVSSAASELAADEALLAPKARKQTEAEAGAANRAIPDQAEVSDILRELNGFAKESRTEIDGITPGTPIGVGTAEAIPISLTFKGRYFGLQRLLKLLRQSADVKNGVIVSTGRLYTVDSIQFTGGQATTSPTGQSTNTGDIAATLTLNAFMYAGAGAPAATTTTTGTGATAAAPTH